MTRRPRCVRDSEHRAERDAAIVAAYRAGETMPSLGARYGITRQRVEQVVRKAGVPRVDLSAKLNAQRKDPAFLAAQRAGIKRRAQAIALARRVSSSSSSSSSSDSSAEGGA